MHLHLWDQDGPESKSGMMWMEYPIAQVKCYAFAALMDV